MDRFHMYYILQIFQVDYSADQWLMKNMDPLNENVVSIMSASTDAFISQMWKDGKK